MINNIKHRLKHNVRWPVALGILIIFVILPPLIGENIKISIVWSAILIIGIIFAAYKDYFYGVKVIKQNGNDKTEKA